MRRTTAHERAIDSSSALRLRVRRVETLNDGLVIVVIEIEYVMRYTLRRWIQVQVRSS